MLYLGLSREAVIGEFHRFAAKQGLPPEAFLPRLFYTYELSVSSMLDLRVAQSRETVGLDDADLTSDDLEACQTVGEAVLACGREGIIAPGAAGCGDVLALFVARLRPRSSVVDVDSELWEMVPPRTGV